MISIPGLLRRIGRVDVRRIPERLWKYRRIAFRLAVFGLIVTLFWLTVHWLDGCCGAVFIVVGVIDAVWIYDMRNDSFEEREEIERMYGSGPRGWH